jgi:hypothetical protein
LVSLAFFFNFTGTGTEYVARIKYYSINTTKSAEKWFHNLSLGVFLTDQCCSAADVWDVETRQIWEPMTNVEIMLLSSG